MMVPEQPLSGDETPRRGRPRACGNTFRVNLSRRLCFELELAAAARGLSSEVLLNSIGRVVLADGLIDAVLDDLPASSCIRRMCRIADRRLNST
jgi:hypothetical protein